VLAVRPVTVIVVAAPPAAAGWVTGATPLPGLTVYDCTAWPAWQSASQLTTRVAEVPSNPYVMSFVSTAGAPGARNGVTALLGADGTLSTFPASIAVTVKAYVAGGDVNVVAAVTTPGMVTVVPVMPLCRTAPVAALATT
jgi:hypothetical protein